MVQAAFVDPKLGFCGSMTLVVTLVMRGDGGGERRVRESKRKRKKWRRIDVRKDIEMSFFCCYHILRRFVYLFIIIFYKLEIREIKPEGARE